MFSKIGRFNSRLSNLLLLAALAFSTGCQSTLRTSYNPTDIPTYYNLKKIPVEVGAVSDGRNTKPTVYYQNSSNGDTGRFDRPVADIVRQAVALELQRAGLAETNGTSAGVIVNCEVLEFRATITQPFLASPILHLVVAIRFQWKDAKTKSVLVTDEQSERRSLKLGMGNVPSLPFDQAVIQDYGNELINDMLPRVIEKEFNSISILHSDRPLQNTTQQAR